MRKKRSMPAPTGGVNITSLCDIMLSLLIFFMLVSKRGVNTGADKDMPLPQTVLGISIEDLGNTVTLNVYAGLADEPYVTTLDPATGKQVTLRITEPGGRRPLEEFLTEVRKHNPEVKLILRGAVDLPYRYLEPVLRTAAAAQVSNVNFATGKVEGVATASAG